MIVHLSKIPHDWEDPTGDHDLELYIKATNKREVKELNRVIHECKLVGFGVNAAGAPESCYIRVPLEKKQ